MLGRDKSAAAALAKDGRREDRGVEERQRKLSIVSPAAVAAIKSHLGGETVLAGIGAHGFIADHDKVSLRLDHPNPNKVHVVVISPQPHGFFNMACYGRIPGGALSAPLIGTARQILPENLATVLGKLTGIEWIHHRHF